MGAAFRLLLLLFGEWKQPLWEHIYNKSELLCCSTLPLCLREGGCQTLAQEEETAGSATAGEKNEEKIKQNSVFKKRAERSDVERNNQKIKTLLLGRRGKGFEASSWCFVFLFISFSPQKFLL